MRKLLLFACALFGFMACTQNPIEEQSAIRTDAPETIRVGFEDDETRIQLNSAQKTVWTKDDLVSVFYKSNANQKWEYRGETGERVASLYRVDAGIASRDMDYVVLAYPYSADYVISATTGNIEATLPATQHYAKGSYGVGSNLMVSQSEFTQFSLKSVCGWLKLQLTGDGEVVKSIKFCGNDGEQVAGLIYVDTATAEATLASEMGSSDDNNAGGNLIFDDTILTEVVLDCGEGVTLGAEPTAFYISLPPQTFANGFTVEIECEDYELMTLTTEKELVIERNHIQPMASVEHNAEYTLPLKQIKYGANSKIELDHWCFDTFGANIVSHEYDETTNMHTITFDDAVTTIGDYAFSECYDLMYIIIPENVTSIGKYAFANSQLMAIDIWGDSINYIGDYAFYSIPVLNSTSLNKIIGSQKDLRYIGDYAFGRCNSAGLQHLILPENLTIGDYAFDYNNCITAIYCTSSTPNKIGTLYLGEDGYIETTIYVPLGSENEYKNAEGWSELRDNIYGYDFNKTTTISFKSEYGLEPYLPIVNFTYEDGVGTVEFLGDGTIIPAGSFCNSTITEITLPHNVTTIGDYAFSSCYRLTSATIPDSVTEIGDYAFSSCHRLTSVTIPDSVTTIGDSAFYGCSRLESATIPDSVTTIGNAAFYECRSLTSVNIPDSVTAIGEKAFCTCSHLTTLVIGSNVKEIGYYAFGNCGSLSDVYCKALVPPITDGYPFDYNSSFSTIYVPTESVDIYQHTEYWWNWLFEGYNF